MTHPSNMKGFTLIELMVSVAIFSVVMTTALGSLLAISYADRKAEALRTVMDNLSFAMEGMSRTIRTGVDYHCGTDGTLSQAQDCTNPTTGSSYLVFLANDGYYTTYCLSGTSLMRQRVANEVEIRTSCSASDGFYPITAPEITISNFTFYVRGATRADTIQPLVTLTMGGTININVDNVTSFALQTSMAQRLYDQ